MSILTDSAQILDLPLDSRSHLVLPVANRASGDPLNIHVHVVKGKEPGPVLTVVANIHGDATFGARAVSEQLSRLDTEFRGTFIGIPVLNPIALESNTRTTGAGWNTDMNNMNRVFPGDPKGWVTQRMAYAVSSSVLEITDALLDYHCGNYTSIDYTLVKGDQTPEQKEQLRFARLLGTEFMFIHNTDPFSGTITGYMQDKGKMAVVLEQGGSVLPAGYLDLSMQRLGNYMAAIGMIDVEPILPPNQLLMRRRVLPRVESGGIFEPVRGVDILAKEVPGGELLGRIHNPYTLEVVQEFHAPYKRSAVLMARTTFGRVNPGDYAYIIADAESGELLPALDNWKFDIGKDA